MTMRYLSAVLVAAFVTIAGIRLPAQQDAGWISLFDGKTLNGWKVGENAATFKVEDGAIVISTFGGPPMVRKIAEALGVLDKVQSLINEQDLRFKRDDVAEAFSAALEKLTKDEAIRLIEPTGAWAVAVRSLGEALDDPAVKASGIVKEIDTDYGGRYRVVTEPLKMSETPIVSDRPAPNHGEHSHEVLAELGYSEDQIRGLLASSAVFKKAAA